MMKRVLLIYPPTPRYLREDRCQIPAHNEIMSPHLPPTDLLYLAAAAERAGAECMVRDYSGIPEGRGIFLRDLEVFQPDFLVISTTTPTLRGDLDLCGAAKQVLPRLITLVKGAHFLSGDLEVLRDYLLLDIVLRNEPEITMEEVVRGVPREEITGITWRAETGIRRNPDRAFIGCLDDLPFPARHLIDNSRYVRSDTGMPQAVIKVSRGCPYHCFYCLATPVAGKEVRRRTPGNIVAEIQDCVERYGIRDFLFWSDVFNTDRSWVLALCRAIQDSGLTIRWVANSRADKLDGEVALAMRQAGCNLVSIGVESGSQELLDRMGKGINLKQVSKAFSILKQAGVSTIAYYQIGLPWETRQSVEATIRFSLELDSDYASFFVSTPLPGTRFYEYALRHGLFENGRHDCLELFRDAYFRPTVRGHYLSKPDIAMLRNKAVRRFFYRPRFVMRNIVRIRSWKQFALYRTAALSIVRSLWNQPIINGAPEA